MFIHIVKGKDSCLKAVLSPHIMQEKSDSVQEVVDTIPVPEEDYHYWLGASQNSGFCELVQRLSLAMWLDGRQHEMAARGHDHI